VSDTFISGFDSHLTHAHRILVLQFMFCVLKSMLAVSCTIYTAMISVCVAVYGLLGSDKASKLIMGHVVATRFTLFIIELFAFHPSTTRYYAFSHDLHLLQTESQPPFSLPEQTSWTERNVAVYSWPARKP